MRNYLFLFLILEFVARSSYATASSTFTVPNDFNTPKALVMALANYSMGPVAENLYKVIHTINKAEQLTGDRGANQAIKLVVIAGEEWDGSGSPNESLHDLTENLSRDLGFTPDNIPNLQILRIPGASMLPWMQDIAKPVVAMPTGSYGLLDLNYGGDGIRLSHVTAIAAAFQLQIHDFFGATEPGEGDQGGNIGVTPEGLIYVGDSSTHALVDKLEALTERKAILIPTNWLMVGHVDEIVAYIPSPRGSILVYADPLAALNKIRVTKRSEIGDEDSTKKTIASIEHLLKPGRRSKRILEMDDFDLSKPMRTGRDQNGILKYEDYDVKANVFAAIQIKKAVDTLQSHSTKKSKPVGVPVLYHHSDFTGVDDPKEDQIYSNLQAFNPMPNLVVLRDHIVVSDSFFKDDFLNLIAPLVGRDKIHFIQVSGLEAQKGSIHCATMVIRESPSSRRVKN